MLRPDIVREKTCAFSGHRPERLFPGGFSPERERYLRERLGGIVERLVKDSGIDVFISGMARGTDLYAAEEVLKRKKIFPHIKLICAIPCRRQWAKWSTRDILLWQRVRERCDLAYLVSDGPCDSSSFIARNLWMVDHSSHLVAVYDGKEKGGTYACLEYAKSRGLAIHIIEWN